MFKYVPNYVFYFLACNSKSRYSAASSARYDLNLGYSTSNICKHMYSILYTWVCSSMHGQLSPVGLVIRLKTGMVILFKNWKHRTVYILELVH